MRRLLLFIPLFLTGCTNLIGPFQYRDPQRVDDPMFSISEQQERGRDRLALPEQSANVAPRTLTEFPGPHNR